MKKLTTLLMCLMALAVSAQENSNIKVEYVEKYKNWTGSNSQNDMLLLANKTTSHYYNPMTLLVDSMLSTPQGTAQYNEMVEAANAAGQRPTLLPVSRTYVIKSFPTDEIKYYGESAGELGHYKEPMSEQNWNVSDTTTTILGYECILAETDYHGRKWKVWFTPEIPIQDGPWKLCGLPGLILKAEAEGGQYSFEATGIENTDGPFPQQMFGHELSEPVNRKEMLELQWTFYNNSAAQMNAMFGISMTDNPLPEGFDLIETDYKH